MTTETQNKLVDLDDLNALADCEVPQELELMSADMVVSTGIVVFVLGAHAEKVAAFFKGKTKKYIAGSEIAKKQNKEVEFAQSLIENSKATEVDGAAIRVTGWKGVKQEFSEATLKRALDRNPHWITQINKFSESVGNFTKKPLPNLPNTQDTNTDSPSETATEKV